MTFHLEEDIFYLVKDGSKDIEIRLYDEKRRKLKIGDTITFINRGNEEEFSTTLISMDIYDNFNTLVEQYPIERMYSSSYTKEELISLLNKFYSKEEQEKYGVVALILKK